VTAKALANAYSQALGNIFTQDIKPFEVEVRWPRSATANGSKSEIYHILYDGHDQDERNYAAMGGQADEIRRFLKDHYLEGMTSTTRCSSGARADRDADKTLTERDLESPSWTAPRPGAKFRRIPLRRSANSWARRSKPCSLRQAHEAADLRPRERVRSHLHPQRPAPLVPDNVARYLFEKVIPGARTPRLPGKRRPAVPGYRFHPEYATPECDDVAELVIHDKAGERIVEISAPG